MANLSNVKLYYFDIGTRGYGQVLRYFLQDNNISYEDVRFKMEEWPSKRDELIAANKMPAATAPFIETSEGVYGRTLPILRRLSKSVPALKFENDDEEYYVDYAADVAYDWFTNYLYCNKGEQVKENYDKERYAQHLDKMERVYAKNGGPYVLGDKISYADYLVYHCLHRNNSLDLIQEKYPALAKFAAAFKERPNLKTYIASLQD
ncbi:hypothetical protein VTP01DRAFT_5537 [Rhizomucor pusillus]|uniref:uncharacterized protein n=1 Tax=Rhizomucor pusillus TaxID=4840 RepID=UPI00374242E4